MTQPAGIASMTVAGGRYWGALCLASLLGADLGDLLAHALHLGHWIGVPPLLFLVFASVALDRRAGSSAGVWFWIAVVLVRAVATNLADLADHDLHLSVPVLVGALGVGLPLVGRGATPLRPGPRFWAALFLAGGLGTVLGDDSSARFGLGPASAGLAVLVAIGFVLTTGRNGARPGCYWPLVLLVRTAGTSIADLLADRSGLGLAGSTALIAVVFTALLLARRPASSVAPA